MSKEIERRFIPCGSAEVRARTENGKVGIAGTAAVIGSLSHEMSSRGVRFKERIAPGAFDKVLAQADMRGLFNHNPDFVLGRQKSGTMRVWADDKGLHYDIPELPQSRADVAEAIQRGDVDGNSFSFVVAEGGDKVEFRSGERIRTIYEFEELLELGPVTFPAYDATRVSSRALAMIEAADDNEKRENPPAEEPPKAEPEVPNYNAEQERLLLAAAEQDGV